MTFNEYLANCIKLIEDNDVKAAVLTTRLVLRLGILKKLANVGLRLTNVLHVSP